MPVADLHIAVVRTAAAEKQFLDVPRALRGDDPDFVPAIRDAAKAALDPTLNLFFRHGDAALFVATVDGAPAGRISASLDHAADWPLPTGHFGHFECIDDETVAAALLQQAEAWLVARGVQRVLGPIDFSVFQGYRTQLTGFDQPAFLGEPRSPEHHARVIAAAGYTVHATWRSWEVPGPVLEMVAAGIAQRAAVLGDGFTVHEFASETDMRADLYELVTDTFARNFGCSKIDKAEFLQHGPSARFTDPDSFYIAHQGRPVAFLWGLRDELDVLRDADGDAAAIAPPGPMPDRCLGFAYGVDRAYRGGGLGEQALHRALQIGVRRGVRSLYAALVKDGRSSFDMLGPAQRTYGVFEREVVP